VAREAGGAIHAHACREAGGVRNAPSRRSVPRAARPSNHVEIALISGPPWHGM